MSESEDTESEESEAAPAAYVPMGGAIPNPAGRLCRCGSKFHLATSHRMCPLNTQWENRHEDTRLNLYSGRELWRWYHFGDTVRKYTGTVEKVDSDGQLVIQFDDGDVDRVSEEDLLAIFVEMKKTSSGDRVPRKRKR